MIRMMPMMTGSSLTFLLNKEWFYKHDLQSPSAIQWMFQVFFFLEDSLGLHRIELIVVGSSDATSFRKDLRKIIKSMFYLFINHIRSVPEYYQGCL